MSFRWPSSRREPSNSNSLFSGAVPTSVLAAPAGPRLVHHAWVKVKLHNYVCRKCGTRKVNVEKSPNNWIAEWHTPDGRVVELRLSPGCVEGPQTAERVAWLQAWLAQQPPAEGGLL